MSINRPNPGETDAQFKARRAAWMRDWKAKKKAKLAAVVPPPLAEGESIQIPQFVLRERDEAYAAGWPSISAYLLGDPLIGRSALERRT
jgi:hypothetical protein